MKKIIIALLLVILIALSLKQWFGRSEKAEESSGGQTLVSNGAPGSGAAKRLSPMHKASRPNRKKFLRVNEALPRIEVNLEEFDETRLTDLQKDVLRELQDALDRNDFNAVCSAVARFNLPESKGGLGGIVPTIMRQRAVQALGWFGSSALSELVQFMADADPQVEQEAFDQFELALENWDIGDRATSKILLQVLSAVNDAEHIDSLLMNLSRMRNSVKAETILAVLETGTETAKSIMRENVEFYTESVPTSSDTEPTMEEVVKSVKDWAEYNPDTESDEEFFGPQKSE